MGYSLVVGVVVVRNSLVWVIVVLFGDMFWIVVDIFECLVVMVIFEVIVFFLYDGQCGYLVLFGCVFWDVFV